MQYIKDYLYDKYVNPTLNQYLITPAKYVAVTSLYGYFSVKTGIRVYNGDPDNWHTGASVVLYGAAGAYFYRAYKRKQARLDDERRAQEAAEKKLYNRFLNLFDFDSGPSTDEDSEPGMYAKMTSLLGWDSTDAEYATHSLPEEHSDADEKSSSSDEQGLLDRIQDALWDESDSDEDKRTVVEYEQKEDHRDEEDLLDKFKGMFWDDVPLTPTPSPVPEMQSRAAKIAEDDVVVIDKESTGQVVMFSKHNETVTRRQEVLHGTNCLCVPCKARKSDVRAKKPSCIIS